MSLPVSAFGFEITFPGPKLMPGLTLHGGAGGRPQETGAVPGVVGAIVVVVGAIALVVGASRKRGDEYPNGSSSATKPAPSAPTPQFPTAKAVPPDAAPSRVPDQLAAATVDVVSNPPSRKVPGMQT